MSLFGRKTSNNTDGRVDEEHALMMVQARMEIDGIASLFNRLSGSCFKKCAANTHHDGTLAVSEMTCIDRCVVKYLECQTEVGKILQEVNNQNGPQ